jgi:hypothetical protein
LDSGAGRSLISTEIFRKLKKGIKNFVAEAPVNLYGVDNTQLNTRGIVTLEIFILGDNLLQDFIVVDSISEDCILGLDALYEHKFVIDGSEKRIYRVKTTTPDFLPTIMTGKKITIKPFSATVVESEGGGGQLPPNLACYLHRGPGLQSGVRLDPFITKSDNGTVFSVAVVNETNKPITLSKYQVIGTLEFSRVEKVNINFCSTAVNSPTTLNFDSNLPLAMPEVDRTLITQFLNKRNDMFASKTGELGKTGLVKHHINTEGQGPIRLRPYRIHQNNKSELESILQELLVNKLIRPSVSPWAAPVVLVKKKSGGIRLCVDYRKLNSITKKDSFPLPRIDDVLDLLHGQKYFSTLDLASGYWQIEMDDSSKEKTAFIVDNNLYEWNRLAFGLTNAPGTFQRLMNFVLRSVIGKTCLVYLDDIIVFSRTRDEHLINLEQIFNLLTEANLKLGLSKCKFMCESVHYLGHVISANGILPDPDKVELLRNFKSPTTITEIQSFLGLASYYRRFIRNFADIAHPLIELTRKKKVKLDKKDRKKGLIVKEDSNSSEKFVWGDKEQAAFETLRECLITPPVVAFPDFSKEFLIFTDASNYGIGAVLSQIQDGKEVVIAYSSRHLNNAERNYSTIEREALAIIFGIKRYHHYLQDEQFEIISDHRPLQWLESHKNENSRLGRWAIELSAVKYKISYKPGREHGNADFLSRIQVVSEEERPDFMNNIITEQSKDKLCSKIILYLTEGILSEEDELENAVWVKEIGTFRISNGVLRREFHPSSTKRRKFIQEQTVVPYSLRRAVVKEYHDSLLAGHLAFLRTYLRVRDKFYWPDMLSDIKKYCMSCEVCALQRKVVTRAFLHPLEIATAPFEVIGMDFLGPVKPASLSGNKYVLVLTDAFSKWTEVVALPNQTAETTCRALMDKIVLYHGPPKVIITDRGTNFTSRLFNNLCRELKTKHKTTTAYHPQSNGMTERFNKTMVEMIRKYIADGFERWEEVLGPMASAYRNSVHASTMETPYFLITARDPNMVVDRFLIPEKELITPEDYKSQTLRRLREGFTLARKNLLDARLRQKIQYDKRAKIGKFKLSDRVLLDVRVSQTGTSKKLNPRYQGPYRISKVYDNDTVEIRSYNGAATQLTHVNRLKALTECMVWRDEKCVDFDDLRNTALNAQLPENDETSDEESEDEFNEDVDEESVHHESNEENDPITVDDSGAQSQIPPPINGNDACVDSNGARHGPVRECTRETAAVLAQPPIAPHADGHPGGHVIEEGRRRSPRTRRRPARYNEGIDEAQLDQLEIDEEVRRQ